MKLFIILLALILFYSCNEEKSKHSGIFQTTLFACNKNSNACVSTENQSSEKEFIETINYVEPLEVAKEKLLKLIIQRPNSKVIKLNPEYITAEFKTTFLFIEFIDDAEFQFIASENKIHIKIESKSKLPDFGRLKRIVEDMRFKFFQNDVK